MGKLGKRIMACLSASLVVMSLAGCSVGGGGNGGDKKSVAGSLKGKNVRVVIGSTSTSGEFRMNRLKDTFKERAENTAVEVADGILVKESVEYTNRTWSDNLMYLPYPDMDSQKNPNLVK